MNLPGSCQLTETPKVKMNRAEAALFIRRDVSEEYLERLFWNPNELLHIVILIDGIPATMQIKKTPDHDCLTVMIEIEDESFNLYYFQWEELSVHQRPRCPVG